MKGNSVDAHLQSPIEPPSVSSDLLLDGTWERNGRSTNVAALIGLLGIGAVFFNAESILAVVGIGVKLVLYGRPEATGGFLDKLATSMRFYAGPVRAAVLIAEFVFLLAPALWLVKRWHSSTVRQYIRLKSASTVEIVLAVLTTLAVIPAGELIAGKLMHFMHVPERLLKVNAEIFTARSSGEFAWLIVVVCLTPAICEEIFFRGYIQRTFERTMQWRSVILVGIFFGLFHFQPLGLVTLAILGILFGYFFYRSKSLFPSMAAHFTNNLVAIAVLFHPGRADDVSAQPNVPFPFWIVGGSLLAGTGLLFLFHTVTSRRNTATTQVTVT